MPICPKCRRTTDDPGYCPYDGTKLVDELPPDTPPPERPRVVVHSGQAGVGRKTDPYDHLIGQTLDGRYQIESRLGEGGMGVVFRATHVVIEKPVAIKVLKTEVARDQNVVRRFVQEARAASRIGHPNIVDVTDFGVTAEGMTYQVMEFIEGQTLSQALREQKPMPIERALPIIAQLCRSLGAAHDKGIVHRDLKPDNVFLISRDGRQDFVKVVDFGIAKVQPVEGSEAGPRLTRAGSVFGTPEYMAPEQATGKGDTDHRVDIYAVGTILYEMLVGRVPHKGETAMRTLAMQLMEKIVPPRQAAPNLIITDGLEGVIMKSLAKERDDRYQSMGEILDGLMRVSAGISLDQPLSASSGPESSTLVEGQIVTDDLDTLTGRRDTDYREGPMVAGSGVVPLSKSGTDLIQPPKRRTALWAALLLGAAAAAAVTIWLVSRGRGETEPGSQAGIASVEHASDASVVSRAGATIDAGPSGNDGGETAALVEGPSTVVGPSSRTPGKRPRIDAGIAGSRLPGPADAGARVDMPVRRPDAGARRLGPDVSVQILTEPRGGRLYVGGLDSGPDGTNFSRPSGTRLTVGCRQVDRNGKVLRSGSLRVEFDADERVVVCKMKKRTGKCVDGIKDPFNGCE